jgi:CheY-like chemotaxis protein
LTFASGGAPTLKVTDELGKMLREVGDFAVRGTSVRCDVELQEPLGAVEIDTGQIAQVIQNLVLNACQASPAGAVVTVRARRVASGAEGARVVIEVSDHGRGIAPEYLPRFTARPGGTGLGLAVSRSIVQRHRGRLSVESILGRGTTFTIELPATGERATTTIPPSPDVAQFSGRALVMDDDDQVRLIAQQLVERLGFDVDVARHGTEALDIARHAAADGRPYRVALLDLTIIGGRGGAEIADELRLASPGIRLVAASGYANDTHNGWDAQLRKPFRLLDLSHALEEALSK